MLRRARQDNKKPMKEAEREFNKAKKKRRFFYD